MFSKKRCDKCSNINNGILSPAIMYTTQDIDHDKCNFNCANDRKPNIFISRIAITVGVILIGLLIFNFYKG